jgi:hypothetical protein
MLLGPPVRAVAVGVDARIKVGVVALKELGAGLPRPSMRPR